MNGSLETIEFAHSVVTLIREADVVQALPLHDAIQDLAATLRGTGAEHLINVPRSRVMARGQAWMHTLRAGLPLLGVAGGKDYTSLDFDTPAMWLTVVSLSNGLPIALIEADYFSRIRTAAVTAVATDLLAPPEVTTLAQFGVGKVSEQLVRAVLHVRPTLRRVLVVRQQECELPGWVHRLPPGVEIRMTASEHALSEAEIVTTATSSTTPVIPPNARMPRLRHLNLVGSNHPKRREIDKNLMSTFLPPEGFLAVDDPIQAVQEAGELTEMKPAVDAASLLSLARLAREPTLLEEAKKARRTAFKTVGVGIMDLALGAFVLRRLGLLPA